MAEHPNPEGPWTIYVCPGCGSVCNSGASKCIGHGLLPADPKDAVGYPEPVQVVPASSLAQVERLREALETAGEFVAVLVHDFGPESFTGSEIERDVLNPIQRALGHNESEFARDALAEEVTEESGLREAVERELSRISNPMVFASSEGRADLSPFAIADRLHAALTDSPPDKPQTDNPSESPRGLYDTPERRGRTALRELTEAMVTESARGVMSSPARHALDKAAGFLLRLPDSPPEHPENFCNRCGCRNVPWSAPNELFNEVNGSPNGIMCPQCFTELASEKGYDLFWSPVRWSNE